MGWHVLNIPLIYPRYHAREAYFLEVNHAVIIGRRQSAIGRGDLLGLKRFGSHGRCRQHRSSRGRPPDHQGCARQLFVPS